MKSPDTRISKITENLMISYRNAGQKCHLNTIIANVRMILFTMKRMYGWMSGWMDGEWFDEWRRCWMAKCFIAKEKLPLSSSLSSSSNIDTYPGAHNLYPVLWILPNHWPNFRCIKMSSFLASCHSGHLNKGAWCNHVYTYNNNPLYIYIGFHWKSFHFRELSKGHYAQTGNDLQW